MRLTALAVLLTIVAQGCAPQVLSEQIQRGMLVREEPTGSVAERARKKMIELISPLTVKVFEEVEREEATKKYYQKMRISLKARPKKYQYFDTWVKVLLIPSVLPLFFPKYWVVGSFAGTNCLKERKLCDTQDVTTVVADAYFIEEGRQSKKERLPGNFRLDKVSLYINGYYKEDLPVTNAGTATVDIFKFPDLAVLQKDVKLTFQYYDDYAYSTLRMAEVDRLFKDAAPLQNGRDAR
jgi:hypothetical protein